jgi:hypothetical protein
LLSLAGRLPAGGESEWFTPRSWRLRISVWLRRGSRRRSRLLLRRMLIVTPGFCRPHATLLPLRVFGLAKECNSHVAVITDRVPRSASMRASPVIGSCVRAQRGGTQGPINR